MGVPPLPLFARLAVDKVAQEHPIATMRLGDPGERADGGYQGVSPADYVRV